MSQPTPPAPGVEDAFGARARALRLLEARLRALFDDAGFFEAIPPLIERPEALHAGARRFLVEKTIVFSDPVDGRPSAIRPDITPQIARLAATRWLQEDEIRVYYAGPVITARADAPGGRREAWQFGVELLGAPVEAGDGEIVRLAMRALAVGGLTRPTLLLGHVGLLASLIAGSTAPIEDWALVVARRSPDDARSLAIEAGIGERAALLAAFVNADADWLRDAARAGEVPAGFRQAAEALFRLEAALRGQADEIGVALRIEPALVPRFWYHDGIVFDGFAEDAPQALLHGGRYDGMMAAHGRAISAVGFSMDLWAWLDAQQGGER